jgi:hypothetical protein
VNGVTQFHGGVKPRRSVHAIQDGVVLGPTVRIRIQGAKDHVGNLSLAIVIRTARAISHNVCGLPEAPNGAYLEPTDSPLPNPKAYPA